MARLALSCSIFWDFPDIILSLSNAGQGQGLRAPSASVPWTILTLLVPYPLLILGSLVNQLPAVNLVVLK